MKISTLYTYNYDFMETYKSTNLVLANIFTVDYIIYNIIVK